MPALSFSVFKEKLVSDMKRQTIRPLRKRPIKVGDKLYLYWHQRRKDCEKLNEAVCSETFFINIQFKEDFLDRGKPIWRVDRRLDRSVLTMMDFRVEELAKRDGFVDALDMMRWFNKKYRDLSGGIPFQVIRWYERNDLPMQDLPADDRL